MDRQEKREIRLQICDILNGKCSDCEIRRALEMRQHQLERYCLDQCSVSKELQQLMNLLGGSSTERQGFITKEETFYIINHVPVNGVIKVAKKLNRSEETVKKTYEREMKKAKHRAG